MDLHLTPEQGMIRDMVREYARDRLRPGAGERDRSGAFPLAELREMAELGLMGVNVSGEFGGTEAGVVAYSLAMTEIAAACAATAVTVGVTNMTAEIIQKYGTEAQKRRFLPALCSGEAVCGAFALSEAGAGSDAGSLRCRAVRDGDGWVLNGEKLWISHGEYAGVTVVMARTGEQGPRGISAFLLTPGVPGFSIGRKEDKMGLRGSNTVSLVLEDARLPGDSLLAGEGDGFRIAMTALDGGRIGIASQALGIARAALEASGTYALERVQFGRPIATLDQVRDMLADMRTRVEAARLLTLRAAWRKEQGLPFTREAALAKLYSSEMANRVCQDAVQLHGGCGFVKEYDVERFYRDVRVTTIYEGTSQVQRIVAARETFRAAEERGGTT
ncbi:MAG: acyl-CoA dehydrogenase family protein [Deltaproteobacteria bacterium]|nr:acyl-CoA dehydrogenase family protein [Deltaproteobacteria bacterium]